MCRLIVADKASLTGNVFKHVCVYSIVNLIITFYTDNLPGIHPCDTALNENVLDNLGKWLCFKHTFTITDLCSLFIENSFFHAHRLYTIHSTIIRKVTMATINSYKMYAHTHLQMFLLNKYTNNHDIFQLQFSVKYHRFFSQSFKHSTIRTIPFWKVCYAFFLHLVSLVYEVESLIRPSLAITFNTQAIHTLIVFSLCSFWNILTRKKGDQACWKMLYNIKLMHHCRKIQCTAIAALLM